MFTTCISDASIIILLFVLNAPVVPDAGKTNEESKLNTVVSLIEPPLKSIIDKYKVDNS